MNGTSLTQPGRRINLSHSSGSSSLSMTKEGSRKKHHKLSMFDLFPSGLCLPPASPHGCFPIVLLFLILLLTCYSLPRLAVPGAPPRKLEVEAMNSTAIRVTWKPPLQSKQHGQIRGYQVTFSRLENGEPRGQPNILDIALPEAQVLDDVLLRPAFSLSPPPSVSLSLLCRSLSCSFPIIVTLHCTFFLSIPQVHTSFPLHQATRAGILRLPLWL